MEKSDIDFLSPRGQLKDIFFQTYESIYGDRSSIKKPLPAKIIVKIRVERENMS